MIVKRNVAKIGLLKNSLLFFKKILTVGICLLFQVNVLAQPQTVTGTVTDASIGESMPGVNIVIKGTTTGAITDANGKYSITVTDPNTVLVISYIGYVSQEIPVAGRTVIDLELQPDLMSLDEVVVVGYGTQKKSDITGTVASLSQDRLEMMPNLNIAQAIQGAIPGVMIQTTSAGASPDEVIMVRGRNSIKADNSPLIVLDGVPYAGNLRDINPNDVKNIEILKDASASAIYGSRGANGVILVTTEEGRSKEPLLSYNGYISTQNYINLPDIMDGEEFYKFKTDRYSGGLTQSEKEIYESGEWVDWLEEGLRKGSSQEHNLSVSGGNKNTTYYIGGGLIDVKGLAKNDNFKRISGRVNIDTKIGNWLTLGTRTQYSHEDMSGTSPSVSGLFFLNPLTKVRDEQGDLLLSPWPEEAGYFDNPLEVLRYQDNDIANQINTANYAIIDFPFIKGLSYKLNTGVRIKNTDHSNYRGRDTKSGINAGGRSDLEDGRFQDIVVENQISFKRDFGKNSIFATAVLGYEKGEGSTKTLTSRGFPNDFLSFYAAEQAEVNIPGFSYYKTSLISQMIRLNYGYDSRYLITLTGRRDGYSGFGVDTKWGIFPSVALAWNLANEDFFPLDNVFNVLKPKVSYGANGNQAVRPYQSIALLESQDMVDLGTTMAGFVPATLSQQNLGWEESQTINVGIDFGMFGNRIAGDLNLYQTNTSDLLLDRTIPSIHGITSIVQNIGKTKSTGVEFSVNSRNVITGDFKWATMANFSFIKNEIVDLYGTGVDDLANAWFIGHPIRVNYDFVVEGVWQLDEAEEAALWGSQPGFVKLKDVDGDGELTGADRQIIGQQDPKFMWGLTNTFSYKNFNLNIFLHGVHGVTRFNGLKTDDETYSTVRRSTTVKNWWTPENPTNEFVMNDFSAERMSGIRARWYENASFLRVKDISLSYTLPANLIKKTGMGTIRIYITGRNLLTITEYGGVDPELTGTSTIPLQRELLLGVNLDF